VIETERILVVDFSSTQAQAKEMAPPVRRGEAQVMAAGAKSLSTPPLLTADRVDKMYRQLVEIHVIATTPL
jgi:hypothetical protein